MSTFAHCEDGYVWRPRHPVVCMLDIVGVVMTLVLVVAYKPSLTSASLPLAVTLQYCVSLLHHWAPYTEWRSKLDRGTIFLVIGATYVPYWANLLPPEEAMVRLPWVAGVGVVGVSLLFLGVRGWLIGIYWAAYASAGLVVSFYELQVWLPPGVLAIFWVGSVLYGVQQAVFALQYPNPAPELFGYREVQHVLLLFATTIGSIVALSYT